MDYFYLSKKKDDALPLLAIVDESTQRLFSLSLPCKGIGHQCNVAVVTKLIKSLGLQNGTLKTDTENAIVALRSEVQVRLPDIGFENAVKGESQTNGPVENAVERIEGMVRTLKSALDARYKAQVHPRHPVLCWMVDYAGSLITRFNRGSDGRTPYERSTGKKWNISLPEFGECVLYKPLKGEEKGSKMEPRFYRGVFLGLQEATRLRWIGTDAGVVRTWTIKWKPVEEQWVMEELNKVIGLPWQLKPSAAPDGTRAGAAAEKEIRIELAPDDASVPEPVEEKKRKGYVPRGLYIRRDIELQQFGYTAGCDGCEAAREGLAHRQHTKACKKRIAEELERSACKKRVQQMREREERYIVAFQERAEREEQKKRRSEAEEEDRRRLRVSLRKTSRSTRS